MLVYSTADESTRGTLSLLENTSLTEVYSICAIRTNAGIRIFDLYVPAGFNPATPKRIILVAPGTTGNARSNIKDAVLFIMKNNSLQDVVLVGIYGRPLPTTSYKQLSDIEDDIILATSGPYTGYTNIKELNVNFEGFTVGEPTADDLPYCNDIDFTRTVVGYVKKFLSTKEVIAYGESNGGVLFQMAYSDRRDSVTKVIANSGSPLTSRTFGHTEPTSTLTLHGSNDLNVPYEDVDCSDGTIGSGSATGYTFICGEDNLDDWVLNNDNDGVLVMNEYGFTPTDEIFESIYDDPAKPVRNTMLYVVGAAHGLGDIANVDDTFVGDTSREIIGNYIYDFIQRYIPARW